MKTHLISMLESASQEALNELYQQIMGNNWKHTVAELGEFLRNLKRKEKYD